MGVVVGHISSYFLVLSTGTSIGHSSLEPWHVLTRACMHTHAGLFGSLLQPPSRRFANSAGSTAAQTVSLQLTMLPYFDAGLRVREVLRAAGAGAAAGQGMQPAPTLALQLYFTADPADASAGAPANATASAGASQSDTQESQARQDGSNGDEGPTRADESLALHWPGIGKALAQSMHAISTLPAGVASLDVAFSASVARAVHPSSLSSALAQLRNHGLALQRVAIRTSEPVASPERLPAMATACASELVALCGCKANLFSGAQLPSPQPLDTSPGAEQQVDHLAQIQLLHWDIIKAGAQVQSLALLQPYVLHPPSGGGGGGQCSWLETVVASALHGGALSRLQILQLAALRGETGPGGAALAGALSQLPALHELHIDLGPEPAQMGPHALHMLAQAMLDHPTLASVNGMDLGAARKPAAVMRVTYQPAAVLSLFLELTCVWRQPNPITRVCVELESIIRGQGQQMLWAYVQSQHSAYVLRALRAACAAHSAGPTGAGGDEKVHASPVVLPPGWDASNVLIHPQRGLFLDNTSAGGLAAGLLALVQVVSKEVEFVVAPKSMVAACAGHMPWMLHAQGSPSWGLVSGSIRVDARGPMHVQPAKGARACPAPAPSACKQAHHATRWPMLSPCGPLRVECCWATCFCACPEPVTTASRIYIIDVVAACRAGAVQGVALLPALAAHGLGRGHGADAQAAQQVLATQTQTLTDAYAFRLPVLLPVVELQRPLFPAPRRALPQPARR